MKWVVLCLTLLLAGCGSNPLSLLTGGGPNVAANVQAGRTNIQSVGSTEIIEAEQVEQNDVKAGSIDQVVVNEGFKPHWAVAFALWSILLWQLPSPSQIGQWTQGKIRGAVGAIRRV